MHVWKQLYMLCRAASYLDKCRCNYSYLLPIISMLRHNLVFIIYLAMHLYIVFWKLRQYTRIMYQYFAIVFCISNSNSSFFHTSDIYNFRTHSLILIPSNPQHIRILIYCGENTKFTYPSVSFPT